MAEKMFRQLGGCRFCRRWCGYCWSWVLVVSCFKFYKDSSQAQNDILLNVILRRNDEESVAVAGDFSPVTNDGLGVADFDPPLIVKRRIGIRRAWIKK